MKTQDATILEIAKREGYELKGVKTFSGMERTGGGFNATLYRKGKRIAYLTNDDSGGETMWEGLSREEEAMIKKFCTEVPDYIFPDYPDLPIKCDMGIFVGAMVNHYIDERLWIRRCKTKTCVLLKSHQPGHYTVYSAPYSTKLADHIRQKYGNDLLEIINERYIITRKEVLAHAHAR